MANQIIVEIIGDDTPLKKTQKELQTEAQKSGEIISANLGQAANGVVKDINGSFIILNQSVQKANNQLEEMARSFRVDIATAFVGFSTIFAGGATKSFFGGLEALTALSAALVGIGVALRGAEDGFIRFSGTMALITGLLVGGAAGAIAFATVKIGELAFSVGTRLVESFQKASEVFLKADRQLLVFSATIQNYDKYTLGAVGTTESWLNEVERIATTFNTSRIELQKAGAEIISVGSKLGLTQEQMQKLLQVTAEYAKINGKDLFQTSVNFVAALNGQSKAVQAYGVKLTEASNQSFIFKKGLTDNFQTLSDSEKAQVRYNNLLSQYSGIAGIAASVSESLSDQDERLAVNLEKVNIELGKGAALIEENNILTLAYNKVLGSLSDTTLQYAGFLSALGARVIQIGGLFLSLALKIFVAISAFKILNGLLALDATQSIFATTLPFLSKSFNMIISDLAGVTTRITSVQTALIAFVNIAKNTILTFGGLLSGAAGTGAVTSFSSALAALGARIGQVFAVLRSALAVVLVPLAPLLIKIGAVVAIFAALRSAFLAIEERTKIFTDLYGLLIDRLNQASPIFDAIKASFNGILNAITMLVDKGFGLFVSGISFVIQKVLELVQVVPFANKVLGDDFIAGIDGVNRKLAGLRDELTLVGFSFSALGSQTLASTQQMNKAFAEVNLEQLAELRRKLEDVGKTDLQKLSQERAERLNLLNSALMQELLTQQQFAELSLKVEQDYAERRKVLLKDTVQGTKEFFEGGGSAFGAMVDGLNQKILDLQATSISAFQSIGATAIDTLGKGIGAGFAAFGKALVKGENALKAFGKAFLGVIGQAAVAVGTEMILRGIAYSFDPFLAGFGPPLIAAGAALATFGGALSAIGGGADGGVTSGLSNPFAGDIGNTDGAELEAKPQTNISVNINGDVLDSQDSGLRIVELLKTEIDRSGSSVVGLG